VPCIEGVVWRLAALGKAAQPTVLPKRAETLEPSGQQLVHVALMTDVEDDPVGGTVECTVDAQCEFDHAQVGRKMTAGLGDGGYELRPNL